MRKFKIENKYNCDLNVSGIYVLWLAGGYFYIGMAKNISRRINQHTVSINKILDTGEVLSHYKLIDLLKKDSRIKKAIVQPLIICHESKLRQFEDWLLVYNLFNKKSLNNHSCHYEKRKEIAPFRYHYIKTYNHNFRY